LNQNCYAVGSFTIFLLKHLCRKSGPFFCVKHKDPNHRRLYKFVQSTGPAVYSDPLLLQNVYYNTSNAFGVMKV